MRFMSQLIVTLLFALALSALAGLLLGLPFPDLTLDRPEMHENVFAAFLPGDKAKTLGVIEPFYRATYTFIHTPFLGIPCCFLLWPMRRSRWLLNTCTEC